MKKSVFEYLINQDLKRVTLHENAHSALARFYDVHSHISYQEKYYDCVDEYHEKCAFVGQCHIQNTQRPPEVSLQIGLAGTLAEHIDELDIDNFINDFHNEFDADYFLEDLITGETELSNTDKALMGKPYHELTYEEVNNTALLLYQHWSDICVLAKQDYRLHSHHLDTMAQHYFSQSVPHSL